MSSEVIPSLGIVLSGFLNALYPVFIRNSTLDLQFKILLRFASFFILSYIYLLVRYKTTEGKEQKKYKDFMDNIFSPDILKVSGLNYLYVAGIIVAMQFAPQYLTFPIFMCWTIVLVLLEKFYFKAPVSDNQIIYVGLGFLGIVIMNIGEFLNTKPIKYNKLFLLVAALSAVAHGVFVPFFKEVSETTNDPIIDTYYLTGFASIIAGLGVFIQHFFTKNKITLAGKWGEIFKLVAFYIVVEGFANYAYYYGLSKLPAVNTAILYNSMVVFGLLIGYFYFKERPTKLTILGVLTIIASIIMVQLNGKDVNVEEHTHAPH
tara:strand:- start:1839 stop:2792 length:954 start_codon:yes stop_codon:yes gene_type:complete